MLSERILKRKIDRMQRENEQLKQEIEGYKERLTYFNEKVHLVENKEREYDRMLEYLDAQKKEYQAIIEQAKKIKKRMVKDFYGVV